ncbi:MAG TPA: hypothetical protein VJ894_03865 [Cryomorphaceae bacterium]|nr:hypothetical protein [Cryomorphaceae bacterium]
MHRSAPLTPSLTPVFSQKLLSFIFVALSLCYAIEAKSQSDISKDTIAMSLFQIQGGFQQPYGDMAELYGTNFNIGFSYAYKTKKNVLIGTDFLFLFGDNVNNPQDIARGLRTSSGQIIGITGQFILPIIQQRGFTGGFYVGKVFPIFGPNPNSGLEIRLGVQYLEHRTWIELRQDEYPPLEGEYRKGYDRKRAGIATNQFIGYRHFSNNRYANFFIGLDFYQGFTTDYRSYNVDQMEETNGDYFDMLMGLRLGWALPVYKRYADKFYLD